MPIKLELMLGVEFSCWWRGRAGSVKQDITKNYTWGTHIQIILNYVRFEPSFTLIDDALFRFKTGGDGAAIQGGGCYDRSTFLNTMVSKFLTTALRVRDEVGFRGWAEWVQLETNSR